MMNGEDLTSLLKQRVSSAQLKPEVYEQGWVLSVGDGVARIGGLPGAVSNELLEFPDGLRGLALNLEEDSVGCVLLGEGRTLHPGDPVRRSGKVMEIPVGLGLLGRVVDPLGQPLDELGPLRADSSRPVERTAPGVLYRQSVNVPLQTGITSIDALIPIGRGQRELIIGDRQTGKTAVAVDTILNQKGQNVLCIYVAIGQKASTVAGVVQRLREFGALEYTTVIMAAAGQPAPLLYIAPYAGAAMGEYFMEQGKDVLIVFDDLSKHAASYREMSLLLRRPPGREAYPGDVFYLHSRLLERAARLSPQAGGGSMTALPIIETLSGDISAYIPTNVISITDGQIFLESDLFHSGFRPAVNIGLSVSRVGGAAQAKAMKQVAGSLRLDLAQYRELAAFAQFGSDLDPATAGVLSRGARMMELLKQDQYSPLPLERQVALLYFATHDFGKDIPVEETAATGQALLAWLLQNRQPLLAQIRQEQALNEALQAELDQAMTDFLASRKQ